ncbi:MAG: glutathione S-transferase family protein [Alphaproteobacteria bacterium]|nr:glutathione S-transferase family protein [Alphaproteobacteria bacterium]
MGRLIEGRWSTDDARHVDAAGRFLRSTTTFRRELGSAQFPFVPGRYRLYVSLACPWAHRTLIARKLKRLDDAIDVVTVDPLLGQDGWTLTAPDENGFTKLRELYVAADPSCTSRVSVPVLWDRVGKTIVNNESAEILRQFDRLGRGPNLYPETLRIEIDALNQAIYDAVNNGVYRAGFAASQAAYEEAIGALYACLDLLEARLTDRRYLFGAAIVESDIRLYTTLVRFDPVYAIHFKCARKRIADYPALSGYLRDLFQTPGFGDTTDIAQIKRHYYASHRHLNPGGLIPLGPDQDLSAPHGRGSLGG